MNASISVNELKKYLCSYGNQGHSYFHLQDGLNYFSLAGIGFVSFYEYVPRFGSVRRIVFANPICALENRDKLLRALIAAYGYSVIFVGLDEPVARSLISEGYVINDMGTAYTLELEKFTLAGAKMRYFRKVKSRHRHMKVLEQSWKDVDSEAVTDLSRAWLASKRIKTRELKLLSRPPVFGDEWQTRKFFCYDGGILAGFIFFDPYFENDQVIGYCANILRADPARRKQAVLDYTMLEAIAKFQSEGVQFLALGLSPFHSIEPDAADRFFYRFLFQWTYRLNLFYNHRQIAFHKARYRGVGSKLWCALPKWRLGGRDLYILLKSTQMI